MPTERIRSLGVLTSGGDAQGMNAAVRAAVRTALNRGIQVYAIYEGYQGMVDGGELIRKLSWADVGGIVHRGGTIIGTARSADFRTSEGRLRAARNLVEREIDSLVVIGGDGSLTGANTFRHEWPKLLEQLVQQGSIAPKLADRHRTLHVAGLVGSIDNDMFGTDMTIGADTALHRITAAIDAISSTAASHQRSFVVEVMGRHCGYLAVMAALATSAEWVLIPENPPEVDDWEEMMCRRLRAGREAGRRDTIVVVAEGAQDRHGRPISSEYVKRVLEERTGDDTRVTILGHVQRGGSPSAFDRNLSTILGYAAVEHLLGAEDSSEPQVFGIRGNRITRTPLLHCVEQTHAVADAIAARNYEQAMDLRGRNFREAYRTHRTLARALPHASTGQECYRLAVMHCGTLAPGMNTAVRAAVRLGLDKGHQMFGVRNGFRGFIAGDIQPMDWFSVNGWVSRGGAELGTNRDLPSQEHFARIAQEIDAHALDGLLIIGGWSAYQAAYRLIRQRDAFPALKLPIVCLPASINNDLPGSELSIGADTALNNIVEAVDKIKQSAVAHRRVYVVEVMGRQSGYLALMSAMATGGERVYLPEEGITLHDLMTDVATLRRGFEQGKQLGLYIRNDSANPVYTTGFIAALFEHEGGSLFDVGQAILGHLQQGGNPTPFDRIQATRLAAACIDWLVEAAGRATGDAAFVGMQEGEIRFNQLENLPDMVEQTARRPRVQWWLDLRPIAKLMSQQDPLQS